MKSLNSSLMKRTTLKTNSAAREQVRTSYCTFNLFFILFTHFLYHRDFTCHFKLFYMKRCSESLSLICNDFTKDRIQIGYAKICIWTGGESPAFLTSKREEKDGAF